MTEVAHHSHRREDGDRRFRLEAQHRPGEQSAAVAEPDRRRGEGHDVAQSDPPGDRGHCLRRVGLLDPVKHREQLGRDARAHGLPTSGDVVKHPRREQRERVPDQLHAVRAAVPAQPRGHRLRPEVGRTAMGRRPCCRRRSTRDRRSRPTSRRRASRPPRPRASDPPGADGAVARPSQTARPSLSRWRRARDRTVPVAWARSRADPRDAGRRRAGCQGARGRGRRGLSAPSPGPRKWVSEATSRRRSVRVASRAIRRRGRSSSASVAHARSLPRARRHQHRHPDAR